MKIRTTATAKPQTTTGWDLYKDGVTQSMITKFLICRHRFWIRYILGLSDMGEFNHRIEYGNMFHAGFEAFAEAKQRHTDFDKCVKLAVAGIKRYCQTVREEHPGANVTFWETIAVAQFPMYCNHWRKEDARREYIFQEEVFDVSTPLPSGRVIRLRGKYDEGFIESVRSMRTKKTKKYETIQENKIKGDVDDELISSSLHMDLQTMTYIHAANASGRMSDCRRVLFNVVQRPQGGKWGGLRQKKNETEKAFIQRIIEKFQANPKESLHRWIIDLGPGDLEAFRTQTLYPILEQIADWWDSIKDDPLDPWNTFIYEAKRNSSINEKRQAMNKHHFARPFGIFDSLALGSRGDYFQFITTGGQTKIGLKYAPLFSELTNASLSGTADGEKTSKAAATRTKQATSQSNNRTGRHRTR